MSKLGNINFSEYDSDEFIGSYKYSIDSSRSNKNCSQEINVDCININNLDLNNNSNINKFSENINNDILSDCEIITYDNTNEVFYENNKTINVDKSNCSSKKSKKSKKTCDNLNKEENIESLFCSSSEFENLNVKVNEDEDLFSRFYDGYNIKKCSDNIKEEKNDKKNLSISKISHIDVIGEKLNTIINSFKTISHLIQYYLRILEETKIKISELDISQSVIACCETSKSLFTYLKAEIERNKPFVLDDKYHNKEGYSMTNGITKIYYIEKIQMKLLDNGECIIGIYDENSKIRTFELGEKFIDASYEGDLYNMLDVSKEKALYFNQQIESKHLKASSIYNFHTIYLNQHK